MKFGNSNYAIFGFAGLQNETRFCTIEQRKKGNGNRVCTYSSQGDLLSEKQLDIEASHLEVDSTFRRAIVYSYTADTVILFDLDNGVKLLERTCGELDFLGFVENIPAIQDVSGKVWTLDETSGRVSLMGESSPILAWASDGSLRAVSDGDNPVLITNRDGQRLFSIPRLGLTCFDPDISIANGSKDILLIEPGAGIRLYSIRDQRCKIRLESTERISYEFACIVNNSDVISLAYDQNSERTSLFYRATQDKVTEICRVGFAPTEGHFLRNGTLFASDTGDLVDLSAPGSQSRQ